MVIDYTITIGNIIETGAIIAGGALALGALRNTVNNLKSDMTDMKTEIKKVGEVLTLLAVADSRISNLEEDVRELKHGEGFILPLLKGKAGG